MRGGARQEQVTDIGAGDKLHEVDDALRSRFFRYCASLHHVLEASGTPEDSIADLRDSPLPIRLGQRHVYDSARDKTVLQLVRVGFAALPHMHGDEIGPDVRRTAVERNIVTGDKVLRTFKTGEAFLMAGADFFGSGQ